MSLFLPFYNSNHTSRTSTPERISSAERLARQSNFGAAAIRRDAIEMVKQNDIYKIGGSSVYSNNANGGGCVTGGKLGVASSMGKAKQQMYKSNNSGLRLTKSAGMTSSSTNPLPPIVPRQKTPPSQLQLDLEIDDALSNYENMVKKSMSLESKAPLGSIGGGKNESSSEKLSSKSHKKNGRRQQRQAHTAPAISVSRSLQQLPSMHLQQQQQQPNRGDESSSIDSSFGDNYW